MDMIAVGVDATPVVAHVLPVQVIVDMPAVMLVRADVSGQQVMLDIHIAMIAAAPAAHDSLQEQWKLDIHTEPIAVVPVAILAAMHIACTASGERRMLDMLAVMLGEEGIVADASTIQAMLDTHTAVLAAALVEKHIADLASKAQRMSDIRTAVLAVVFAAALEVAAVVDIATGMPQAQVNSDTHTAMAAVRTAKAVVKRIADSAEDSNMTHTHVVRYRLDTGIVLSAVAHQTAVSLFAHTPAVSAEAAGNTT